MKQKIVIKVQFSSEKSRTQAFKIAAGTKGVTNVSIEADKDEIVVIGDGVDSVCLTKLLRKKLSYAKIETIEEVKKPDEEKKPEVVTPIQYSTSSYFHYPQYPMHCDVVYRWKHTAARVEFLYTMDHVEELLWVIKRFDFEFANMIKKK